MCRKYTNIAKRKRTDFISQIRREISSPLFVMLYDYGVIGGSLLLLLVLGFHFTDKERWFNIVAVILGAYVWQRWFNEVKLVELWSRVSTETVYGFAVIGGGMALFILAERLYPDQKLVYVPG